MQRICDQSCLDDHRLYAAKKTKCLEAKFKLSCNGFYLQGTLGAVQNITGKDSADNPLDCEFEGSSAKRNFYYCESYQGSPYANLKLSSDASLAALRSGRFKVQVLYQDFADMNDRAPWRILQCFATDK